ncbi:uncharacterized protein LOC106066019 isoform X1 [Biomphalaria glabrata]|uniref:Uncharacterized protein LOC106066019 isoform X1 n=1 Tax=Biomphalaria glabrata TaxID=6526 RepID=A0A9U8EAW6_BIOGL|nr:uncharacterized protein LOC106066019 isoform X1 [Biomphalaria glabrata]XP_013080445.2 uncharacterized protein LOC106066019 isoform X1 [Biomphalaria glabrata]XP_013080446.2 uncharacterized protein LOC106066019 isoform X1 [Biomphalaria glabrata]XP_055876944.1 uncharacterized protein LOC106066019 isoform X1 [Biomphalaria glabrata]
MDFVTYRVVFALLFSQYTCVAAQANPDVVGMAVAGCVSFVMACVIIAYLFLSFGWPEWFDHWMKQRNKVRMPRDYFKKKDEIKKKLLNGSLNGSLPSQKYDRVKAIFLPQIKRIHLLRSPKKKIKKTSWTQGWNQRQPSHLNRLYEEKDATMELGEEDLADVEFKIETVVVDNEHLDVGPFKNDHSREIPISGDIYNEPYIYTTVNTLTKNSSKRKSDSPVSEANKLEVTEMIDLKGDLPLDSSIRVNHFDEALIHL